MVYLHRNLTVLFDTILGGLIHADWHGAWARAGAWGWVRECLAALTGFNAWPFFVDARGAWSAERVAALLQEHGIATWGWGYAGGKFYFRVKMRQARWAQHLLLHSGVPVGGRLLDEAPASQRTVKRATAERATPPMSAPEATASSRSTPLQQLDHLLDRISDL